MSKVLSSAQKRAAVRSAPEEDPEFQIAPMIDILLVLLVFFMSISSTEVLQTNDHVQLPVAKESKEHPKAETKGQSIINVLWNPIQGKGSMDIDEKSYEEPSEITGLLKAKLLANPDMRIYIRADKETKYEFIRKILVAAAGAGVNNVTFAVVDKDQNGGAPAAAAAPEAAPQ